MTEIEQIKERNERRKRLISEGASADSKTFVEQVYEMKEVNRLIPADFDYLITTIESQKETIDEQYHTISTSNIWNSKLKDEIESLKAITELAVKGLKKVCDRYAGEYEQRIIAKYTLDEIEKLQK